MKYIYMLTITAITMLINIGTSDATISNNNINEITIAESDKAEDGANVDSDPAKEAYKGRNENVAKESLSTAIDKKSVLTKSVTSKINSSTRAQLENFETTMGELVQKIEDDRLKKMNDQKLAITDNINKLSVEVTKINSIDETKLGSEQDPSITNAFKCDDASNCHTNTDNNNIRNCADDKRLNWNGSVWRCIGIFDEGLSAGNCGTDQYKKVESGGYSCVSYIYMWKETGGYGACINDPIRGGIKEKKYKCYKKKTVSDNGNVVTGANAKCYTLVPDYVACPI